MDTTTETTPQPASTLTLAQWQQLALEHERRRHARAVEEWELWVAERELERAELERALERELERAAADDDELERGADRTAEVALEPEHTTPATAPRPPPARNTPSERARQLAAAVRRHGPGHCVYAIPRAELPSIRDAAVELARRGIRCIVCGSPARGDDFLVFNFRGRP